MEEIDVYPVKLEDRLKVRRKEEGVALPASYSSTQLSFIGLPLKIVLYYCYCKLF